MVSGFLVITVSHPTFCCVGVGFWLRWGWAMTIGATYYCFAYSFFFNIAVCSFSSFARNATKSASSFLTCSCCFTSSLSSSATTLAEEWFKYRKDLQRSPLLEGADTLTVNTSFMLPATCCFHSYSNLKKYVSM